MGWHWPMEYRARWCYGRHWLYNLQWTIKRDVGSIASYWMWDWLMSKGTRRWNRGFSTPPHWTAKQWIRATGMPDRRLFFIPQWIQNNNVEGYEWAAEVTTCYIIIVTTNECGISRQTLSRIGWWAEFVWLHWMRQSQLTRMCFPGVKAKQHLLLIPWFNHVNVVPFDDKALQPWELGREALLGHLKLPVIDFLSCGLEWYMSITNSWHIDTTIQITYDYLCLFIYIYMCVCMCVLCECVCEHMLQATSCYAMFPFLLSFHYSIFVLVVSIDLIVPQLELIFTESQPGQTCLQQKRRIRNSEYDAYISRLCVVHCAIEILMFFKSHL